MFLMLGDRMDVEKPQRVPFSVFSRHCETFFQKKISPKAPLSIFDVLQQWMLKHTKGSLLLARRFKQIRSNFLGFSGTVEENT